jgi:hypothetical protein
MKWSGIAASFPAGWAALRELYKWQREIITPTRPRAAPQGIPSLWPPPETSLKLLIGLIRDPCLPWIADRNSARTPGLPIAKAIEADQVSRPSYGDSF